MNKELYLKLITDSLGTLSHQIEYRNSVNLYDINIISEDFFRDFLNLVYGYNLINLNTIEKNASAIDLGDITKKIAIQVTSDNSSTKIDSTIEKFIEKKLYDKYDRLLILIITRKKKYRKEFETKKFFSFNREKDILDNKDILQYIKDKDTSSLTAIAEFLEKELSTRVNESMRKQATEIDTIIELIEYLSNNRGIKRDNKGNSPDPEHKINKRFEKYAEFLKDLYKGLVTIYGAAVEQAFETLGLDDIKTLVIGMYLKDISDRFLEEAKGNPKLALENLTNYFEDKLSGTGKKYDKMAIKFFLISQTIACNVFPNGGYKDEPVSTW